MPSGFLVKRVIMDEVPARCDFSSITPKSGNAILFSVIPRRSSRVLPIPVLWVRFDLIHPFSESSLSAFLIWVNVRFCILFLSKTLILLRFKLGHLAEEVRFELTIPFQVCRFSKPVPSTTQPLLHKFRFAQMEAASRKVASCLPPRFARMKSKAVCFSSTQPLLHWTAKALAKATIFRFASLTFFVHFIKKCYYTFSFFSFLNF